MTRIHRLSPSIPQPIPAPSPFVAMVLTVLLAVMAVLCSGAFFAFLWFAP